MAREMTPKATEAARQPQAEIIAAPMGLITAPARPEVAAAKPMAAPRPFRNQLPSSTGTG